MKINYDSVRNSFDKYVDECRNKIKETFFDDNYLLKNRYIKEDLVSSGKIKDYVSVSDSIKYQRLSMIDIKINHTMRVVEDSLRIADKIGTPVDFNKLLKVAALLHDVGRFDQATWNNSFADSCYKDIEGINNHAQAGYHILFVNDKIKDFDLNPKLYPAIGSVVYNHGNPILTGDLALRTNDFKKLDINNLTGLTNLNESEKIIVAALVQLVRDVDMLDILYQHLTGEFPVVRESISYKIENDSLIDIAKYWGIDPKDILDYNGINEENFKELDRVSIPVNKINPIKLSVPLDIQERFFRNEDIDLKEINSRRDWTFITGMWWRLNHFLNNISFTSNLQLIEEKNLLEQIYNTYPDNLKPLVKDAFEYACDKLIRQVILDNSSSVYVTKGKTK